jgi:hypothetical protein
VTDRRKYRRAGRPREPGQAGAAGRRSAPRPGPIAALAVAAALLASPARAQSTAENVEKYHALRARLLTEFTVVGEGPGDSQPADVRDEGEGFIKWSDSTIRLGWYLGLLATEYHLYAHPALYPGAAPAAPETTLDELHDALFALERIDRVADAAFPPPCSQGEALNGFFVRDDVPEGYHQHFPPLTTTYSDFVDPVLTNKEMSQDQVYHLLMGLALVSRLVPATVSVKGRELAPWAVSQSRRIVEHFAKGTWIIENPACDRVVERGPAAAGYSGGTRLAIHFITGDYKPDTLDFWIDLWATAREPAFPGYLDIDNLHMAMAIAAVGDGWGATTSEDLALLGEEPGWPFYTLLHRVLHGDAASGWCRSGLPINAQARRMLDELPLGADIASPQPGGPAVHGFTRSNRFMRGKESAYTGEEGSEGYRFNGMDYMLLHNLYAIATPATWDGGGGPGIPGCTDAPPDGGATSGGGPGGKPPGDEDEGGCACRAAPRPGPGSPARGALGTAALALALLGARERARRRRRL